MTRSAERLAAGVHCLPLPTSFAVGAVNVYLIEDEPLTLVDTGVGTGAALMELEQQLAALGHRLDEVELVLLTHHHPDHSGLAASIARRAGAEIAGLDLLAAVMEDYERWADAEVDGASRLMQLHGVDPRVALAVRRMERLAFAFTEGVRVDRVLSDGAEVALRDRTFSVLHRPGHSQTDTIFHDRDGGLVLGGDHLLARISSNAVIGLDADGARTRPLLDMRRSLEATRGLGAEVVLGGHGPVVADPTALIDRRLRDQESRAQRILELMRPGPATAYELATGLLGAVAGEHPFLAVSEVVGHVDLLLDAGDAVQEPHADVVRFAAA